MATSLISIPDATEFVPEAVLDVCAKRNHLAELVSWKPHRERQRELHASHGQSLTRLPVLDRVTMQVFVRDECAMIAAPVQCNVDGISKGSHYARVPAMG